MLSGNTTHMVVHNEQSQIPLYHASINRWKFLLTEQAEPIQTSSRTPYTRSRIRPRIHHLNLSRCTSRRCTRSTPNSHPIRDFISKCSRIRVWFADFVNSRKHLSTDWENMYTACEQKKDHLDL